MKGLTGKGKIWVVICLFLANLLTPAVGLAAKTDIPTDVAEHWAQPMIADWVAGGLANDYPDGTFKPDEPISQTEFIDLLKQAFDYAQAQALSYNDQSYQKWFSGDIASAKARAFLSADPGSNSRDNDTLSRQEGAVILARVMQPENAVSTDLIKNFADYTDIAGWSQDAIAALLAKGYISGYTDHCYYPQKAMSRAEAISLLNRMFAFRQVQPGDAIASIEEQNTGRYFEKVRTEPLLVRDFLLNMPKGDDLHNHMSGAIFAEQYISWAAQDGYYIDTDSCTFMKSPQGSSKTIMPVAEAIKSEQLYNKIIDTLSMRNFTAGVETGHDHFFNTFEKFGAVADTHPADMLAAIISHAQSQNIDNLELMAGFQGSNITNLVKDTPWDIKQMDTIYKKLVNDPLFKTYIKSSKQGIDFIEADAEKKVDAANDANVAADKVEVRYICSVNRTLPNIQVFALTVFAYELCRADSRVVGITFLAPEDNASALANYKEHMQMLEYLNQVEPGVNIDLHAGELSPEYAGAEDLRFHIREAVEIAHAKRVGHGVDVKYEDNYTELLKEMAESQTAVDILLTSNDQILGIKNNDHPFTTYLSYGVPVVLATDDEGVSRNDLTNEFQRASQTYNLKYQDIKMLARNSLEYSFLPGTSIWRTTSPYTLKDEFAQEIPGSPDISPEGQKILAASQRAAAQWDLETEFREFEQKISPMYENINN